MQKFYYRVIMVGTMETGYHPFVLYRSFEPYPTTELRREL